MHLKDDCLFCKIIQGKIPAQKIFENEHILAFKDLHPQAPHHILIIPKFHVDSAADLKEDQFYIMGEIFKSVQKIADQLGFRKTGFRTVVNTGEQGGQTVFHMHLHILAGSQMSGRFS